MDGRLDRTQPRWLAGLALLLAASACGGEISSESDTPTPVRFDGALVRSDDLSAVTLWRGELVVASDEGARLQRLIPVEPPLAWRVVDPPIELLAGDPEIDLEALTVDGDRLYALGSHSIRRPRIDDQRTRAGNLERWTRVRAEPARQRLFRLQPGPEGDPARPQIESISLRPQFEADPILNRFSAIPGKENGIDLEGLARLEGRLVLGFRSPVLRQGLVPLALVRFDEPASVEYRFLDLDGRGIRALENVTGGLLILAADERPPSRAALFFWDGRDGLPGREAPAPRLERLLDLEPRDGSPEGLALLEEDERSYRLLVIHDGVAGGDPRLLTLPRPALAGNSADQEPGTD